VARSDEGLRSEALKQALNDAVAGKPGRLEDLLARHGGLPGRPNLKLAAAFGAELAALPGEVVPLLTRLANDDSREAAREFLPIAAAHGLTARLREAREVEACWRELCLLSADDRGPVRVGTIDALRTLAVREGGADELVRRAAEWLEVTNDATRTRGLDRFDREVHFGSAALALEVLADAAVMPTLRDDEALFAYVSSAVDAVADAPRAAERSEGRRRVLVSLPGLFTSIVVHLVRRDAGLEFLEKECARNDHPEVRKTLSDALQKLRASGQGERGPALERLRKALDDSAKPLRFEAFVRPGTGRGHKSRRKR
jgi:hypothetical protein